MRKITNIQIFCRNLDCFYLIVWYSKFYIWCFRLAIHQGHDLLYFRFSAEIVQNNRHCNLVHIVTHNKHTAFDKCGTNYLLFVYNILVNTISLSAIWDWKWLHCASTFKLVFLPDFIWKFLNEKKLRRRERCSKSHLWFNFFLKWIVIISADSFFLALLRLDVLISSQYVVIYRFK